MSLPESSPCPPPTHSRRSIVSRHNVPSPCPTSGRTKRLGGWRRGKDQVLFFWVISFLNVWPYFCRPLKLRDYFFHFFLGFFFWQEDGWGSGLRPQRAPFEPLTLFGGFLHKPVESTKPGSGRVNQKAKKPKQTNQPTLVTKQTKTQTKPAHPSTNPNRRKAKARRSGRSEIRAQSRLGGASGNAFGELWMGLFSTRFLKTIFINDLNGFASKKLWSSSDLSCLL